MQENKEGSARKKNKKTLIQFYENKHKIKNNLKKKRLRNERKWKCGKSSFFSNFFSLHLIGFNICYFNFMCLAVSTKGDQEINGEK